jgi:hypothetical protein
MVVSRLRGPSVGIHGPAISNHEAAIPLKTPQVFLTRRRPLLSRGLFKLLLRRPEVLEQSLLQSFFVTFLARIHWLRFKAPDNRVSR